MYAIRSYYASRPRLDGEHALGLVAAHEDRLLAVLGDEEEGRDRVALDAALGAPRGDDVRSVGSGQA